MIDENISQELRLKKIDKEKNSFSEEIHQNYWMSKKRKKVCACLSYVELVLASVITGCVSISAFASLIGIPIDIESFVVRLKIYAITAGIKKKITFNNI